MIAWLMEHVADIVTKYLRGRDVRAAYERLFGKHVHEESLEFGEQVFYRKRKENDTHVILEARWLEGLWLGRCWGTPRHSIGDID